MNDLISRVFPFLFPFLFVGFWVLVTSTLARRSGWYDLAEHYPDKAERPILRLRGQSGRLGDVSMAGLLRLDACPSGLRVGIWRAFGLFSRDFLVPWKDIHVQLRRRLLWGKTVDIQFGQGAGRLSLPAYTIGRIARAIPEAWPEAGSFERETTARALLESLKVWAVSTGIAALFFTVIPLLISGGKQMMPPAIAILFPSVVFGVGALINFYQRTRP